MHRVATCGSLTLMIATFATSFQMTRHSVARREISNSTSADSTADCEPGKLCPMCEAAFPGDVDPEAFESHVLEHFILEEAETIKYVAQEDQQQQLHPKAVN